MNREAEGEVGKAEVVGGSVVSLKLPAQAGEQGRLVVEKELLKGGRVTVLLLLLGVKVLVEEKLVAGVDIRKLE